MLVAIKGLGPGGAERLIVSAAERRDRDTLDYEVAYLLPWKDHLVPVLERAGVTTRCLEVRRERDVRWALRLRRLLVEGRYDVIHLHSPYVAGIARLVVLSLPRRQRPAIVSTEHNVWSSFAGPTRLVNAASFRFGDAWLAVSEDCRASIPPRLRDRVEVVVHGVPLDDVRAFRRDRRAVRNELGVAPDEVAVLTIAHLTRQKGYPDLMEAANVLVERGLPVRFFSIGHGPLEAELHARHEALGLGERFRFLGYREDAVRVLAGCDVFALASVHEGYPVSLMEALVLGIPVVATAVGGVPDAVDSGVEGLLVPPRRPDLLAGAIEALVTDPAGRARMSQAAAARGGDFDISIAARRIEAVYREAAATARARRVS